MSSVRPTREDRDNAECHRCGIGEEAVAKYSAKERARSNTRLQRSAASEYDMVIPMLCAAPADPVVRRLEVST
jgi:hypothetical protein